MHVTSTQTDPLERLMASSHIVNRSRRSCTVLLKSTVAYGAGNIAIVIVATSIDDCVEHLLHEVSSVAIPVFAAGVVLADARDDDVCGGQNENELPVDANREKPAGR